MGHLQQIARVLAREAPDVVALQEADAPSSWSGSFDHVAYLADAAGYAYCEHGLHANLPGMSGKQVGLSYGTALLARRPMSRARSQAFTAGVLDTKGDLLAEMKFAGRELTVVSVHLDFRTAAIRRRQAHMLIDRLRRCQTPLIVMGDFNSAWDAKEDALRLVAEELNLRAYRPSDATGRTYPAGDPQARIDWILISNELEFRAYHTLPDRLSDHLGVFAELAWR
jgi:endonuclease/exonuclease/phosphatase family metal-dependent hydrolase